MFRAGCKNKRRVKFHLATTCSPRAPQPSMQCPSLHDLGEYVCSRTEIRAGRSRETRRQNEYGLSKPRTASDYSKTTHFMSPPTQITTAPLPPPLPPHPPRRAPWRCAHCVRQEPEAALRRASRGSARHNKNIFSDQIPQGRGWCNDAPAGQRR